MLLSIVVSFKNEEENLPELIRRIRDSLAGVCQHEIVFVNDASTDRSLAILREQLPKGDIRIITTSRSFGHGPCLYEGLKHAKGDAVVYVDADIQDPPEMIPQLIERWQAGHDVVITRRKAREGETWLKMWVTKKAYQFLQHAAPNIFVENAGDFRLISRKVVNHLTSMNERDPIFRGLVSWAGFRVAIVEYVRAPRYRGTSHHGIWTGVPARYFFNALAAFSNYPLYMILAFGLFSFFGVFGLAIASMGVDGSSPQMNRLLLTAIFLNMALTALVMAALGMIGLYVSRIYQQVRGRPDLIIDGKEGF